MTSLSLLADRTIVADELLPPESGIFEISRDISILAPNLYTLLSTNLLGSVVVSFLSFT